METKMSSAYNPADIETRIREYWQDKFVAPDAPQGETFSIVMPPPNVTGALHMGHALDCTLQDVLTRWKRMQGYATLWLPGTDHAGIATQVRVEEKLREQGLSRHDLGREKFLEQVWNWKDEYHGRIVDQLEKMGISCDWSRERFTLDEGCSQAVREVFVRLYEKGLIYQGEYIVNWCPRCQTAISDIEVEHKETDSHLWHIKYPLADGSGQVVIATTRPETMLGDTAVAVHPDDERYSDYIGREIMLPIAGRLIPIITDEHVDPEFGTGAVKVTPAHDPNDFEIGLRHGLPHVVVIDTQGNMTEAAGKYAGQERYQCRKELVAELEELGFLVKVQNHVLSAGHCERCATIVEPLISKQWFVKMKPLAESAIAAVRQGDVEFFPARFAKTYYNWMENIRDWCISRQLWWGHRIPAWHCPCGETIVSLHDPQACPHCGGGEIRQDEDVLDTWFSSALWPFSTMGWPEQTDDLKHYFPTSVMITGYDIIFFWVARMIFSSLEFTGKAPFKDVYLHGLIRDELGRKMSKSLGNGIDPLEIIEEYGADTLRFALLTGAAPGNDIRFQQDKVEASRNFANKIWNASRFVLMNLDGDVVPIDSQQIDLPAQWILERYNQTINAVTSYLAKYELGEAAREIYEFLWNEFCDWYIEAAKLGLADAGRKDLTQAVLKKVLLGALQLLHPIMPFITEEIWQQLEEGSIAYSQWPTAQGEYDGSAFATVIELVRGVRNMRSELKINPGKKVPAWLYVDSDQGYSQLAPWVCHLARASELQVIVGGEKPREAVGRTLDFGELLIPLAGVIDVDHEIQRLEGEISQFDSEVERLEKKLGNSGFVNKAPQAVVEGEREKLVDYKNKRSLVLKRIAQLKGE